VSDETVRIPVACPHCQSGMGHLVNVQGSIYLDVGNFMVVAGHRFCHSCGRPFHFQRPSKPWPALVQRHQQRLREEVTAE
jgi:hypothetical protein